MQSTQRASPTARWDTALSDSRSRTWESHAHLDLRYEIQLHNGANLTARLFHDDYWREGDWVYDYAEPGGPPDLTIFQDTADGGCWGRTDDGARVVQASSPGRGRRLPREPA